MNCLRFLRPYLCEDLLGSRTPAYARFFNSSRPAHGGKGSRVAKRLDPKKSATGLSDRHDIKERLRKLDGTKALLYPRIQSNKDAITCREFNERYNSSSRSSKQTQTKPISSAEISTQFLTIRGTQQMLFLSVLYV